MACDRKLPHSLFFVVKSVRTIIRKKKVAKATSIDKQKTGC